MLAGPLFTSEAWPWPCEDGRWLEPVLQVDLATLGALGGVALGDGWLQVWATGDRAITRVVPVDQVATAPLTPLPSADPAAYHQRLVEPADDGPGWWAGHAITGFDTPFLDYGHNELDCYVDWLLDEAPAPLPPDVEAAARRLKGAIDADRPWYELCHRAFGMVNEGDVEAGDLPPVLWVLEEGRPLRESGNANDGAYVCYERAADGDLCFSVRGLYL